MRIKVIIRDVHPNPDANPDAHGRARFRREPGMDFKFEIQPDANPNSDALKIPARPGSRDFV